MNTAIQNNIHSIILLKKHPILKLILKSASEVLASSGLMNYDGDKMYQWKERYNYLLFECINNFNAHSKGEIAEIKKYISSNLKQFPPRSNFLKIN